MTDIDADEHGVGTGDGVRELHFVEVPTNLAVHLPDDVGGLGRVEGASIAESDNISFFNNVELIIISHEINTSMLITDNTFSNSAYGVTIVASSLANNSNRLHSDMHVNVSTGFELTHINEYRDSKRWFLDLGCFHDKLIVIYFILLVVS